MTPTVNSRTRLRSVALASALAVAILVSGCGAEAGLQRQEAAARARWCESYLERRTHDPPPRLDPKPWLGEARERPALTGLSNEKQMKARCDHLQAHPPAIP